MDQHQQRIWTGWSTSALLCLETRSRLRKLSCSVAVVIDWYKHIRYVMRCLAIPR